MSTHRRTSGLAPGSSVRSRAAWALEEVLVSKAPADRSLALASEGLSAADQSLLFELVRGSLRWLRRLDWVLGKAAGRPFRKIEPQIRAPLRIAAYQLLLLDRIPAYAAVNEAVDEVRRRKRHRASGFANAVLRRVAERRSLAEWPVEADSQVVRLALEHSHPDFLVARWLRRFGSQATIDLLEANNQARPTHLLCFGDRSAVAEELARAGVETRPGTLSPRGLRVLSGDPLSTDLFASGRLYIQDDASQAAALIPAPRKGEIVLDAAASPGGKGFALASAQPDIKIVSGDLSLRRLQTLKANHSRLGIESCLLAADARNPPFVESFDRVLLDLPCSGTGTIARHPELKWRVSQQEVLRLAEQGEGIVEASGRLVRPGGLLCVITCSIEEEENESIVHSFLERHPEFTALHLGGELSESMAAGVEVEGRWRVLPATDHDGFTVHVLRRAREVSIAD